MLFVQVGGDGIRSKQQLEEVKNRRVSVIRADVQAKAHNLGVRQSAVLAAIHDAGTISLGELAPHFPRSAASRCSAEGRGM